MVAEALPLRLPPPGPDRERVLANALLVAIQTVPRLESAVERIEAAALVASGAAARAIEGVERLEGLIANGHGPKVEKRSSDRPVSANDLRELENRVEEATNPDIRRAELESEIKRHEDQKLVTEVLAVRAARRRIWEGVAIAGFGGAVAIALWELAKYVFALHH